MRKNFNSKVLFTIFVLCCFMATGLWATKKVDISQANANSYVVKLNQQGFESTSLGSVFGLTGDEGFTLLRQRTDFNRVTHKRYLQVYRGIPVWGTI